MLFFLGCSVVWLVSVNNQSSFFKKKFFFVFNNNDNNHLVLHYNKLFCICSCSLSQQACVARRYQLLVRRVTRISNSLDRRSSGKTRRLSTKFVLREGGWRRVAVKIIAVVGDVVLNGVSLFLLLFFKKL